jgi:DNA-binding winged helix-turn-helix (wHTH) protein
MTQSPGDNPARRLGFGRFAIDLERSCLLSDGREIPLRPVSFVVLTLLVRRAGQTVPAEDLLQAGWPDQLVPEETLAQSIAELRRALDDGESKLIVSVPPTGYRLDQASAPRERRHAPGIHALRWRWMYGLLAPLVLAIAFVVIWLATRPAP